MQFKTDAQKICYDKVVVWLTEKFKGRVRLTDELPALFITQGTAILQVALFPWGDVDSVIQFRSYIVSDVELTPSLIKYLLTQNVKYRFGSLGLDTDGDIILEHSLIGSVADKTSVQVIAEMILAASDKLDDEIMARWGGQRAVEPEIS